ncbi:MAG: methyltransferase domain-containing protein [Bacteroidota bacterium]
MTDRPTKDILQWDTRSWSKALDYWDKNIDWSTIQNGLELGGREGGLSLWLALKGKQMVCSDLKNVRITAGPLHARYNVKRYIDYQDIDATHIPYEDHFDIIVFKSIIGGIGLNGNYEIQKKVFKEIYKALKPGGRLLFAENLIASPLHRWLRKKYISWGSSWRYVSTGEMKVFMEDFSFCEIKTSGFLGTFGRNERQRNLLSAVDQLIFNRVCPDQWNYICYGSAQK